VFHLSSCSKNVTKLIISIKCKYLKLNQINLQEMSQDVFRIRPNEKIFLAKLILQKPLYSGYIQPFKKSKRVQATITLGFQHNSVYVSAFPCANNDHKTGCRR